ncbi:glycosyltransferase [Fulvivirga sp. 2943]|uniref:Glycosyltransferase n=1 Tax=Fulvivirga sediminis TaxID=2803949 RepID=A0A937JZM0_9BACT|nr:glycosyltransferase [Fulvivirga sediminis]
MVCAHNEEENLRRLLPLLYEQNHPDYEIIIVDDRSYDGTYDFLLEEAAKNSKVKIVKVNEKPENFNGKKYALTLGIKAAKKENIILTDADCTPASNNWLTQMSSQLASPKTINLGFSYYEQQKGFLNTFIRFDTLWTAIQYLGMALVGKPYMGVGRNLAYTRSLFIENKGFTAHMKVMGGDDDLFVNQHTNKGNTAITLGEDTIVYSKPKTSWKLFFRQKIRHLAVGKHYKSGNKVILGLFSLSHIFFWLILGVQTGMQVELYFVIGSFFIKTLLLYLTFIIACKKLGVRFNLWSLIFLDIIFVFYYSIIGLKALFTKRVRWI